MGKSTKRSTVATPRLMVCDPLARTLASTMRWSLWISPTDQTSGEQVPGRSSIYGFVRAAGETFKCFLVQTTSHEFWRRC
jgi:hypothetical protein